MRSVLKRVRAIWARIYNRKNDVSSTPIISETASSRLSIKVRIWGRQPTNTKRVQDRADQQPHQHADDYSGLPLLPPEQCPFQSPDAVGEVTYRTPYGVDLSRRYGSMGPNGRWRPELANGEPDKAWWSKKQSLLHMHPEVIAAQVSVRQRVLAGECYAYNRFTEHLENGPVMWLCHEIAIRRLFPCLPSKMQRDAKVMAAEEAHHELFSSDLVERVERETGIPRPEVIPAFKYRLGELIKSEGIKNGWLVLTAFVIGSETLITSTLSTMASDEQLKAIVRAIMKDHAEDEMKHRSYFTQLCSILARHLDDDNLDRFARLLPRVMAAYLEPDLAMLEAVARNAGLSEPYRIARETAEMPEVRASMKAAAAPSLRIFRNLGLLDRPGVEATFIAHGLL